MLQHSSAPLAAMLRALQHGSEAIAARSYAAECLLLAASDVSTRQRWIEGGGWMGLVEWMGWKKMEFQRHLWMGFWKLFSKKCECKEWKVCLKLLFGLSFLFFPLWMSFPIKTGIDVIMNALGTVEGQDRGFVDAKLVPGHIWRIGVRWFNGQFFNDPNRFGHPPKKR